MKPLDHRTCKAARAYLDWTAAQLGDAASVPVDTIRSFESGRTKMLNRDNEAAIRKALEAQGVQFLEAGQVALGAGIAVVAKDESATSQALGRSLAARLGASIAKE